MQSLARDFADTEPEFEIVDKLEVDGRVYVPWQEAVEREDRACAAIASAFSFRLPSQPLTFPPDRELEPVRDEVAMSRA